MDETSKTNENNLNLVDLQIARTYFDSGYSLVPIGTSKKQKFRHRHNPDGSYRHWTWNELAEEWQSAEGGIGINCGFADLRVLDIEDYDYYTFLKDQLPEIVGKMPVIRTPSNGAHCPYRSKNLDNKRKVLARDIDGDILIETREQGQYVVAPGSCASCHPSGKSYSAEYLDYSQAPYLTDDEIEELHNACREYNDFDEPTDLPEYSSDSQYIDGDPNLPSIKYAAATTWNDILIPLGWKLHHERCDDQFWIRPDAKNGNVDAVTYGDSGKIYFFSSSITGFDLKHAYSKAQFLCVTKFDGNWKATVNHICEMYPSGGTHSLPDDFGFEAPDPSPKVEEPAPAPEPTKRKRKGYHLNELEAMPAPQWHVDQFFTVGGFVVIFGTSGNYKSFVSLDWAMSCATGTKYLGRFPVKKSKVCYVVSEGASLFRKRARAWLIDHGLQAAQDICFVPHAFKIHDMDEIKELLNIAKDCLGDVPDMIVFDTLSRNFDGDPNSNERMQEWCNQVDKIRDLGITCVAVHHTGWQNQDRERSAINLRDSADTSILCEKSAGYVAKLTCKKQKDAEDGWRHILRGKKVDVSQYIKADDMDPTSLVFEYLDATPSDDETVIELLEMILANGPRKQGEVVKDLQNLWKGEPPGINTLRDTLENLVGTVVKLEVGDRGAKLYSLMS